MNTIEKKTEQDSLMHEISQDMLESVNGGQSECVAGARQGKKCAMNPLTWTCPACGCLNTYNVYFCCSNCGAPEPR